MTQIAPEIVHYALTAVFDSLDRDPSRPKEDRDAEKTAAAMMDQECLPQNATEPALAMRAVIAHHASADCFRRANFAEIPLAQQSRLIARGTALSRLSLALGKALRAEPGRIDSRQSSGPATPATAPAQVNPEQSGDVPTPRPAPVAGQARTVTDPQQAMRTIMTATGRGGRKYAVR